MRKIVTMYAKFAFVIYSMAIAMPFTIVLDIVKDIICVIILLFQNKFNMIVMRADIAEIIYTRTQCLKNAFNTIKKYIGIIIED